MSVVIKRISIEVGAGTVTCKPSGGSVKAREGHKIKWKTKGRNFRFKIKFGVRPVDGIPTASAPWPFGDHPPPAEGDNSTGWVTSGSFVGKVAFDAAVFEYEVIVPVRGGVAVLDPMIIVGR
jgi:hypothetical protein